MPEHSPLQESATAGKCEGRLYGMNPAMAKKSAKAGKTVLAQLKSAGFSEGS